MKHFLCVLFCFSFVLKGSPFFLKNHSMLWSLVYLFACLNDLSWVKIQYESDDMISVYLL